MCRNRFAWFWTLPTAFVMTAILHLSACSTVQPGQSDSQTDQAKPRESDSSVSPKTASPAATPTQEAIEPVPPPASPSPTPAPAVPAATSPATPLNIPGAAAVGDLLVAPTRLLFEGSRRSAEITLVNIGNRASTYRISFMHLRMTPEGALQEYETPGPEDRVADPLIRFSPRQVELEPNIAQTVRLQLRKPADLGVGEYRSHLLFRAIPRPEELEPPTEAEGLQIRLVPIYGVSIPLIVRHGETSATVRLSDFEIVPGPDPATPFVLNMKINRAGNASAYGNVQVVFIQPGQPDKVVGFVKGIAVYLPLDDRTLDVALRPEEGVTLRRGKLRVRFFEGETGETLLAESELELP